MPEGTDIGHVHLHVADLEATEAFYCGGLGLDLVQRYGDSAIFMSAGGYHHHVGANTWAGRGAPPPPPDAVGLRYFTVQLPSQNALDALLVHLAKAHVDVVDDGDQVVAVDPSGNSIMLRVSNG
jgi:catechol 2,3-dioxygenase